jgi:hypothetical protein
MDTGLALSTGAQHQPALVFHDVRNVDELLTILRDHHWAR